MLTSETEETVNLLLEIRGVDDYETLTGKIYDNKHVRVSDMQSFPQKGKQLLTVHVPESGGVEFVESFLLDLDFDYVLYNGLEILTNELSKYYTIKPKYMEIKKITKPK